jgi:ADP-heptose:LPS heptosyltransferase
MKIKSALTFRASSIGDSLMGKYLLENIHFQYPQARLAIVVAGRGKLLRDLFSAYAWLEIREANRRDFGSLVSLVKNFYRSDLVITQYAGKKGGKFSLTSKLAARFLAKRGGLIGFGDEFPWNSLLYNQLLPVSSSVAVAEHERSVLRAAGLEVVLPFPRLRHVRDDSVPVKFKLVPGKYIVVHFFPSAAGRGLSFGKKQKLVGALTDRFPGIELVLSGSGDNREEAELVLAGQPGRVIAGLTTLQELMNIIERSLLVVSVDTGVAHIAAQLSKPLVVLRTCLGANWWLPGQYGSAVPISVFSSDQRCRSGHVFNDYPECINSINEIEVADKARLLWSKI